MAKKPKRKLKIKKILLFVILLAIIIYIWISSTSFKIRNIIVKGNEIYTDQEIIDKAGLTNYPSTFKVISLAIKSKLEKDIYIKSADIKKTLFKVTINIKENKPLFYYEAIKKTVLYNEKEVDKKFNVPAVINYVPDEQYEKLVKRIQRTNEEVLERISEIKYDPNDVDDNRFYLTMNDGNHVYLTLNNFSKINSYIDMIKKFDNKKGTLYLDSGAYFEVLK